MCSFPVSFAPYVILLLRKIQAAWVLLGTVKTLPLKITCVGRGFCTNLNARLKYRGYFKHISKPSEPWRKERLPKWTNHL